MARLHCLLASFVSFLVLLLLYFDLVESIVPLYNTTHIYLPGFNSPESLAIGNNEIFVSDSQNHLVKRIDLNTFDITIVAGTGTPGFDNNTSATSAMLHYPCGLAFTSDGKLLIADTLNHAIREVSNGQIKTLFGKLGTLGSSTDTNTLPANILLNQPKDVSCLSNGDIFFSDAFNYKIRKFSKATGYVSTVSLISTASSSAGVATYSSSEMTFSETNANRLRRYIPGSSYYLGVGSGSYGDGGGNANVAMFNRPTGLAYGPNKHLYVADRLNHVIRILNFSGTTPKISLLSGVPQSSGSDLLKLNNPYDVDVTSQNHVYILDTGNTRIRKMTPYCAEGYTYNNTMNECIPVCFGDPQYTGDVCSGRGLCYDYYNCTCFNSSLWGGSVCETPKCANVLATDLSVCSGLGSCVGPNNCTCRNSTSWGGQNCNVPKCGNVLASSSSVCSGKGQCVAPDVCNCIELYGGLNCETPKCSNILATSPEVCNSKGKCIAPNNCTCLVEGYYGNNCDLVSCFGVKNNSLNVCSGKGMCLSLNNCTCQPGFYGENCQHYDCFGIRHDLKDVCSSFGNCSDLDTCICKPGYYGNDCEIFDCFGVSNSNQSVCSGNGRCQDINTCSCEVGYFGLNCETFNCSRVNKSICQNGYQCSPSGTCTCAEEWGGDKCDKVKCYSLTWDMPNVCSGNGKCSSYNNCTCDSGWLEFDCSLTTCYGILSNNQSVCSGKGSCKTPDECSCNTGFTGGNCQYNICYSKSEADPNVCSGNGQCKSPDTCECSNGFVGNECQYVSSQMDIENAVVYSYSNLLNAFLISVVDGCEKFIDESELYKLGQVDLVKCQWRRNNFKIFLGYNHLIENGTIIKTNFGVQLRVDFEIEIPQISAPSIQPLIEMFPNSQDLIIRSYIPPSFHHFKKVSQSWIVSSTLGNLLDSNNSVIVIPNSLLKDIPIINGLQTFNVNLNSSNDQQIFSSFRSVQVNQDSQLTPSFNILVDQLECRGYDCMFEVAPLTLNTTLSYEISETMNIELSNKQMLRITKSKGLTNFTVIGSRKEIQSTQKINLPIKMSPIGTFDLKLTNVNRTISLNSGKMTIDLETDPFVSDNLQSFSFSWFCYSSNDRVSNLCDGLSSRQLELDFNLLGFSSGNYLVGVNVTNGEMVPTYFGYIDLINSDISVPKITPDYIPSVHPTGKKLSLYCIVESESQLDVKWNILTGKLKSNIELFTQSNILVGNSIEVMLNIGQEYLIEGEFYEFELVATNTAGTSKLSLSTRIDLKPRFTCLLETLKNEREIIAFETLVSVNCITLPQEKISSIVMEVHSQNERLFILSNSFKNTMVTQLPFSESNLVLVVKMINEFGSITEFRKNFTTLPPERISNNSLLSRIDYVNEELNYLIQSKPLTIDTINSINTLLSIIKQDESLTNLAEKMNLLDTKNKSISILINMLATLKDITSLSYNCDEKLVQLIIPSISNIFSLLDKISSFESSEIIWWMDWIYSSMNQARSYYSNNLFKTLLDSKHVEEISNLQTILSNMFSNNTTMQAEIAKYHFEYYKLTGKSIDNSISTQILPLEKQFNSKSFNISKESLNVKISFPSQFSNQVPNLESKSIIFHALSMINNDTNNGNILKTRPSLDLSIYDRNGNSLKIENLLNPITIKFEGLYTDNKTVVNASCVYLDASNNWSQSGISSSLNITKQSGELVYFDLECQVYHLSLFTIQELPSPPNPQVVVPPIFTEPSLPSAETSNNRIPDNTQQGMDTGILAVAIAVPIAVVLLLLIIFIIILLIFIVWRMKRKAKLSKTSNLATVESGSIELVYDNLPTKAYYLKPSSGYSFQIENAFISQEFNPHLRYTNIARIGSGNVFKVIDSVKNCSKAIKIIKYHSEEDLNKFLKEAIHLMNTKNCNTCKINEIFISTQDQKLCIDMDYFEMGDFSKLTNRNFNISEQLVKQIIFQICTALEYSHCTEKCIHGNIKPSNLLIKSLDNDNIHALISDFGIFGTNSSPIYSSPEIVSGYKHYFNTDIFSLGVVMYQIMTKDTATSISELYGHRDEKEVVQMLRKTLVERYSNQVIDLLMSMLEKDNLTRPQAQDILSNSLLSEFKKKK